MTDAPSCRRCIIHWRRLWLLPKRRLRWLSAKKKKNAPTSIAARYGKRHQSFSAPLWISSSLLSQTPSTDVMEVRLWGVRAVGLGLGFEAVMSRLCGTGMRRGGTRFSAAQLEIGRVRGDAFRPRSYTGPYRASRRRRAGRLAIHNMYLHQRGIQQLAVITT